MSNQFYSTPKKAPHLHNAGREMDGENEKCHPLMLKLVYDTSFIHPTLAMLASIQ